MMSIPIIPFKGNTCFWLLMLQSHATEFRTRSIRYQNRIDPVSVSIPEDSVTTIRRKTFCCHVQKFLQIFRFRINIRIKPVQTASTRFNPQRKTASTLVVYRHDPDLIRVKMSRMGGNLCYSHIQLDFEPGPYAYRPGSTRTDPVPPAL
jgi:hypothetical protein